MANLCRPLHRRLSWAALPRELWERMRGWLIALSRCACEATGIVVAR